MTIHKYMLIYAKNIHTHVYTYYHINLFRLTNRSAVQSTVAQMKATPERQINRTVSQMRIRLMRPLEIFALSTKALSMALDATQVCCGDCRAFRSSLGFGYFVTGAHAHRTSVTTQSITLFTKNPKHTYTKHIHIYM